ncbi:MAG: NifB/NifX family molybdenum-iron cluster-binding protein [Gammaproteobacteria bacterium]
MKIAVATENSDPSAEISSQGARALYFLLFDGNGNLDEILKNPYLNNEKHVGPDVAKMLFQMGISKVIAGRFGPKFKEALEANQIACIENTGVAVSVVKYLIH